MIGNIILIKHLTSSTSTLQPSNLPTLQLHPMFFNNLLTQKQTFFYICAGVSLLRPAPLELPQGGNAARVES
ncbi:MAG: hypothetical protein JWQ63_1149 [Mucilaginibacter sp.]|nr:hypothetical protein [Mucilaginibacter sp.]